MSSWLNRPNWQLAIVSGTLVGLSYPVLPLGFLAWIGFIPLIHILTKVDPWTAFRLGYLAGVFSNLFSLYWIGFNSGAGFVTVFASLVGAILYLGLFWGLFALVLAWLQRLQIGLLIWPFLWVIMEYIRSFGAMGFPWINLATTQVSYLPMVQLTEITGSYGVAFWIIVLNVGLYRIIVTEANRIRNILGFVIMLLLIFVSGFMRIVYLENKPTDTQLTVAIVQPNLNPNDKWENSNREFVFDLMDSTLIEALKLEPQLVLWPESAVPAYLRINGYRRKRIEQRVKDAGIPLLTGSVDKEITEEGISRVYNGSLLIRPDGTLETYHKIHLVPFGEYIPLSWKYPLLKKLNFGQGNFDHGQKYTVFELDSVNFSNLICYESSFPQQVRKFIKEGARLITIETNDAWFGRTSGPYQHYDLAILRAVENRVPIARSANTGISGFIKLSGRSFNKIPFNQRGIVKGILPIPTEISFYARYGDLFTLLCIISTIIITGVAWKRKYFT